MGQTIRTLAERELPSNTIFNNRFVVEACEAFHVHYRNLRLLLSMTDWMELSKGMKDAFERWQKRGQPMDGKTHIELCRKQVALYPKNEGIKINLNKNLYPENTGKIFSEGAEFSEKEYVHLKIRDLRLEMSIDEFKLLAEVIKEADEKLCSSSPLLPAA